MRLWSVSLTKVTSCHRFKKTYIDSYTHSDLYIGVATSSFLFFTGKSPNKIRSFSNILGRNQSMQSRRKGTCKKINIIYFYSCIFHLKQVLVLARTKFLVLFTPFFCYAWSKIVTYSNGNVIGKRSS